MLLDRDHTAPEEREVMQLLRELGEDFDLKELAGGDCVFERTIDTGTERGSFERESGRFRATLATDGESSDGHILSMAGASVPKRMPMLLSHENDPTAIMGSFVEPVKSDHAIKGVGVVNLTDDGTALADKRLGISTLIESGDLTGVSIRWDPVEAIARTALPKTHPAFVDAENPSASKRWGLFFKRWTAREASLVALGADPQALIGRADACKTPEARAYFRLLAGASPELAPLALADLLTRIRSDVEQATALGLTTTQLATHLIEIASPEAVAHIAATLRDAGRDETLALIADARRVCEETQHIISDHLVLIGERELPAPHPAIEPEVRPPAPPAPARVADLSAAELFEGIANATGKAVAIAVKRATGRI